MRNEDLPQLQQRLNQLADYYGNKQPTNAALTVWLDCLKGAKLADVLDVLTDWPKSKPKFPVGMDVMLACQDKAAKRDVERTRTESELSIQAALARAAEQKRGPESQLIFEQAMTEIRTILRMPKPHPLAWLDKLHERQDAGEVLNQAQLNCMREADIRVFGSLAAAAAARRRGVTAVSRKSSDDKMDAATLESRMEREAMQGDGA